MNIIILELSCVKIYINDFFEKNCPLNSFISLIENFKFNSEKYSDIDDLKNIVKENNVALKNIGCSVYKGYTYLTAHDEEKRRILCNYLNLWLDEKKSINVTNSIITDTQWELIEELWNLLKQRYYRNRCDRQEEINTLEIRKRINLMVYCVNRDYLKNMCSRAINSNHNIENKCSGFSMFTNKYYEQFLNESGCFGDTINPKDHRYFIDDNCNLHNMAITFPKFDSESKQIVYNHESRKPIEKCKNTIQSGGDNKELAAPSETELTSTDKRSSKPVYCAGLSALGIVFTSIVLYKYTTLGSFI
ncbi:CYIR protein, partial [Plasmodium cynomolgi strain B]